MVLDQNKNSHEVVVNENVAIGGNAKSSNNMSRVEIYIDIAFLLGVALIAFIIIRKIINAHKTYVQKRIASSMAVENTHV